MQQTDLHSMQSCLMPFCFAEHSEEKNSLGDQQVGEEEKLSPDSMTKEVDECSALAVMVEGQQEAVEMN